MSAGAIMREIHRLRRNAKDLKTRIDQGPRSLKGQKDKVTRQEENLRQAQEEIKHIKINIHEKEVSIKSADEKIKKYEKQLSDIMSKKEYEALKTELAHAREQVAKLEDEALAFMTQIEEKTPRIPELEKSLAEARTQAAQFERQYEERQASLVQQHKEVLGQLAAVEATLPDDIRIHYERLISAMGEDALTPVENRTCSACYTEITAQSQNELLRGLFILCKNCGRIMYLAE